MGNPDLPAVARNDESPASARLSWSGRRDSNPRPSPWQGDALPTEPRPHFRPAGRTGPAAYQASYCPTRRARGEVMSEQVSRSGRPFGMACQRGNRWQAVDEQDGSEAARESFGSRDAAEAWLSTEAVNRGVKLVEAVTVGSGSTSGCLEGRWPLERSTSTREVWRLHLRSTFGPLVLTNVSPVDVRRWYAER